MALAYHVDQVSWQGGPAGYNVWYYDTSKPRWPDHPDLRLHYMVVDWGSHRYMGQIMKEIELRGAVHLLDL